MENSNTGLDTNKKVQENLTTPEVKTVRRLLKFILSTVVVVVLAGSAGGYYFFYQKTDFQAITQNEVRSLVAQVSEFMILPDNETPTVATVSDPEKLKGQAFFVNAQKGDKVLIYTTSKKAILYRPFSKKIIEVAPINLGAPVSTSEVFASSTPTPTSTKKR